MKRYFLLCAICLIFSTFVLVPAHSNTDRWAPLSSDSSTYHISHLSQPLVLDGEINEWSDTACVSTIGSLHIAKQVKPHKWLGPADSSMQVRCAWSEQGLCLAAVVADDDVRNTREGEYLWQQDCFEVFLDCRSAEDSDDSPYFSGTQILVRPPLGGQGETAIQVNGNNETPVASAGKITGNGYTLELLIPWSDFPEFTSRAGAKLYLQCALDDYDARDGITNQPQHMTWSGYDPWTCWKSFTTVELFDKLPADSANSWITLDTHSLGKAAESFPVTVYVTGGLARQAKSVRVSVVDSDNDPVFTSKVPVKPCPVPWQQSCTAAVHWLIGSKSTGYHTIEVVLLDGSGTVIGSVHKPVLCVAGLVENAMQRLEKVDLGKLAQSDPFKAAEYLAVGSCVEKLKRAIETRSPEPAIQSAQEVKARLGLLETGKAPAKGSGLYDLLNLTTNYDAQVVVEYVPDMPQAIVTFYCGSVPMVTANVQELASEKEALERLESEKGAGYEPVMIDGHTGALRTKGLGTRKFEPSGYSPEKHVCLVFPTAKYIAVIPVGSLRDTSANSVVVLPDCPAPVRDAVEKWAGEKHLKILGIADALQTGLVLVAGNINSSELAGSLQSYTYEAYEEEDCEARLLLALGNRLISVVNPSAMVAKIVAGLVADCRPVNMDDSEQIRRELVASLKPASNTLPSAPGMNLFSGDVHVHTFFSDGTASPVGFGLEAMRCFMDFVVITDHNTIEGAQLGQKLLLKNGFTFPCIAGEEITTNWAHFNAYPLKQVIPIDLPLFELTRAVHSQGAVIQWDHPGGPSSEWAQTQKKKGLNGTSLDAWEHRPSDYDELKAAGACPTIVGSTDNHGVLFGSSERTAVLAPSASGIDVAEAIRYGQAGAIVSSSMPYIYGSDALIDRLYAALNDGESLRQATAQRLRKHLSNADLTSLLKSSQPTPADRGN